MNLLPTKSWHVRRKHNIERVRKDEAQALEKELELQKRRNQYETEAKLTSLRKTVGKSELTESCEKLDTWTGSHINFFENIEKGAKIENFLNEEREKEKKDEIENWEKKVGILTYLGQSVVDAQKNTPWYLKQPEKSQPKGSQQIRESKEMDAIFSVATQKKIESQTSAPRSSIDLSQNGLRSSINLDPKLDETLSFLSRLRSVKKKEESRKKDKHHKNHRSERKREGRRKDDKKKSKKGRKRSFSNTSTGSSSQTSIKHNSTVDMDKLRLERLRRENQERIKAENLLRSEGLLPQIIHIEPTVANERFYNSQYNPNIVHDIGRKK